MICIPNEYVITSSSRLVDCMYLVSQLPWPAAHCTRTVPNEVSMAWLNAWRAQVRDGELSVVVGDSDLTSVPRSVTEMRRGDTFGEFAIFGREQKGRSLGRA